MKYFTSNISLYIELSIVNLKKRLFNNLCEKAKAEAVFTLETDYSCETSYPFDDSRQIGNTS